MRRMTSEWPTTAARRRCAAMLGTAKTSERRGLSLTTGYMAAAPQYVGRILRSKQGRCQRAKQRAKQRSVFLVSSAFPRDVKSADWLTALERHVRACTGR